MGKWRKNWASKASREILGREAGAALSPSPGNRSARFVPRYFSYLTPFFSFSPTAEPGLRLLITNYDEVLLQIRTPFLLKNTTAY